jgi:hypothetical protein
MKHQKSFIFVGSTLGHKSHYAIVITQKRGIMLILCILFILCISPISSAGAPIPKLTIKLQTKRIVQNGAITIDVYSNGLLPTPDFNKRIKILKEGSRTPILGRWKRLRTAFSNSRTKTFVFQPLMQLKSGTYQLKATDSHPKLFFPNVHVEEGVNTKAPTSRGLKEAVCQKQTVDPLRPSSGRLSGVALIGNEKDIRGKAGYVVRVRKEGTSYEDKQRWIGSFLSEYQLPSGEWIATLRAVDNSGNEGGDLCEVKLKWPVNCTDFPTKKIKQKALPKRNIFSGSLSEYQITLLPLQAKCAKRKKQFFISTIDGMKLK